MVVEESSNKYIKLSKTKLTSVKQQKHTCRENGCENLLTITVETLQKI